MNCSSPLLITVTLGLERRGAVCKPLARKNVLNGKVEGGCYSVIESLKRFLYFTLKVHFWLFHFSADVYSCPGDQFVCWDGEECIPRTHLCDGAHDCSDGSDEHICGDIFYFFMILYLHFINKPAAHCTVQFLLEHHTMAVIPLYFKSLYCQFSA